MTIIILRLLPERVGDGHEPLQVDPCQIPDHEGVDQVNNEAGDLTEGHPCHRGPGQDGGGGEEEKGQAEDTVGQAKMDQQETAGLPGLKKTKFADF